VTATVAATLAGLLALFVRDAFFHAWEVWSTTEEFSYGFAVAPVSAAVIWWRRAALRRACGTGSWTGLVIVLGGVALYLLGRRASINAVAGLAVLPLLWGTAVFLWGWAAGRVLAFPIGFLAFGLGLYRGLLSSVGFAQQGLTARGAATLTNALGVATARDGLVVYGEDFGFVVAEACSGMSSLLSLLALASLWIYLVDGPLLGRLLVLGSVAPLVIAANIVRVTLVLLVAAHFGQDAATGFFHGASSLVLFGIALGGLMLVSWVVGCKAPRSAS
jgi:exosortase